MANKHQREISKLNRKLAKKKANQVVVTTRVPDGTMHHKWAVNEAVKDHSHYAFLDPAEAIASKKQRGIRSWKVSKKHPANSPVK